MSGSAIRNSLESAYPQATSMVERAQRVAVIGAGVSGVTAAAHLIAEHVDVIVFERAPVSGGVWSVNKVLKVCKANRLI